MLGCMKKYKLCNQSVIQLIFDVLRILVKVKIYAVEFGRGCALSIDVRSCNRMRSVVFQFMSMNSREKL